MEESTKISFPPYSLAELHAHLAASINPFVYWEIAHDHGFKLPQKDYEDFVSHITLSSSKKMAIQEYFDSIYHPLLDKLSSGTFALEKAVYEIMRGAYRNNITLLELRTNPLKHNRNAEIDVDYIIMAMLRGMERAMLEYRKLSAGIIFCLDRQFSFDLNRVIVEKAIKYRRRGIVGLDVANYDIGKFHFKDYAELFQKAKDSGLKITVHSGETDDTNDMWDVIEYAKPQRIGHGIKAAYDKKLMDKIKQENIVLEICPLSNIVTKAVKDIEEMKFIIKTFSENDVTFCINTDWPEIIENAYLVEQYKMLRDNNILSEEELKKCNEIAFASTFVPLGGLSAYL